MSELQSSFSLSPPPSYCLPGLASVGGAWVRASVGLQVTRPTDPSYKNFFKRTIVHIKPFTVYNGQAEIIIEILKEVEKKHEDKDSTEHIFSEQIQLGHIILFIYFQSISN